MANLINFPNSSPIHLEKAKGYYKEAFEALKTIPYAIRMRGAFSFSRFFARFYHFISVLLGLATAYLITTEISGFEGLKSSTGAFIGILFFILLLVALSGIEILKKTLLISIFKKAFTDNGIAVFECVGLVFFMALSIGVSAIGGGFLTIRMKDKTPLLKNEMKAKIDSVQDIRLKQIALLDSTKTAYFNQNKWNGRLDNTSRPQFNAYEEEIASIRQAIPKEIEAIKSEYQGQIYKGLDNAKQWAIIAGLVVLCFELFTVLAYWFRFYYWRVAQQEGTAFNILPQPSMARQKHGIERHSIQLNGNIENEGIGFKMAWQDVPKRGYEIECDNCGAVAIKTAHNARFCSDSCRYAFHRKAKVL